MPGAYILDTEINRSLHAAQTSNNEAIAVAMDEAANRAILRGGACDERALEAAFFGHPVFGDELDLSRSTLPRDVVSDFGEARKFQYKLGEPFVYTFVADERVDIDRVGVIARSPDELYCSPVLTYRVNENRNVFTGRIAFGAFMISRDAVGNLPKEPKRLLVGLVEYTRGRGQSGLNSSSIQKASQLVVGMPNIRKTIADDWRYITKGAWRSVDESVARIRKFAGESIMSKEAFAAD